MRFLGCCSAGGARLGSDGWLCSDLSLHPWRGCTTWLLHVNKHSLHVFSLFNPEYLGGCQWLIGLDLMSNVFAISSSISCIFFLRCQNLFPEGHHTLCNPYGNLLLVLQFLCWVVVAMYYACVALWLSMSDGVSFPSPYFQDDSAGRGVGSPGGGDPIRMGYL